MTRAALLISNPGEPGAKNYCKGVYVDVTNYGDLLRSAEGGAWREDEIRVMDRPDCSDVRNWIRNSKSTDYAFIMFSGHGWFSSIDNDRILELKKSENFASSEFFAGFRKCNVVLDCCQEVHHETLMEKTATVLNASRAAELRTADRNVCRRLFDDSVANCSSGFVRATSCSTGEKSWDDDTSGGKYNSTLLQEVENWVKRQASKSYGNSSSSIVEAHEAAAPRVSRITGYKQNPSIEKDRSGPYFPIAVFG